MADDLRARAIALRDAANRLLEALHEEAPTPTPPPTPDHLDTDGFAAYLHVSRSTVKRMIADGLPVLRIGRAVRIPVSTALRWIELQKASA